MAKKISSSYQQEGLGGYVNLHDKASELNETGFSKSYGWLWYVRTNSNGKQSLEKFDAQIGTRAWIRDNYEHAKARVRKISGVDGNLAERILERLAGVA